MSCNGTCTNATIEFRIPAKSMWNCVGLTTVTLSGFTSVPAVQSISGQWGGGWHRDSQTPHRATEIEFLPISVLRTWERTWQGEHRDRRADLGGTFGMESSAGGVLSPSR